jgi:hypothetical protein
MSTHPFAHVLTGWLLRNAASAVAYNILKLGFALEITRVWPPVTVPHTSVLVPLPVNVTMAFPESCIVTYRMVWTPFGEFAKAGALVIESPAIPSCNAKTFSSLITLCSFMKLRSALSSYGDKTFARFKRLCGFADRDTWSCGGKT